MAIYLYGLNNKIYRVIFVFRPTTQSYLKNSCTYPISKQSQSTAI